MMPTYYRLLGFALVFFASFSSSGFAQVNATDSTLYARGLRAFEAQHYAEAEEVIRTFITRHPDQSEARYVLAQIYAQQRDSAKAAVTISRAIFRDPEKVELLEMQLRLGFPRNLSVALRRTKKHELAERILKLDSTNALANLQIGGEEALIYLHHRNRITIPHLRPLGNASMIGKLPDLDVLRESPTDHMLPPVPDPFDLESVQQRGYQLRDLSDRAEKAYPIAVHHLTRALASEPTARRAYMSLAALYVARPDHEAMMRLATTMRRHFPEDPYSGLFLGFAAYKLNQMEQATQYFSAALDRMPPAMHSVFGDLRRVMNENQLKNLPNNELPPSETFWTSRDPHLLTHANERELEHYARLVYAKLLFSEPKLDLEGWDSERGRVYVRYGTPENDFFLSNIVAKCAGRAIKTGLNTIRNFHVFDYGAFRFVFGNHGLWGIGASENPSIPTLNEFPIYSPCSQALSFTDAVRFDMDYVIKSRETIRKIPEQFVYEPPGRHIDFPFLASRFKGHAGKTDLYLSFGIPLAEQASESQTLNLGLQTGAFLVNETEGRVAESRYAVGAVSAQGQQTFSATTLWVGTHKLAALPGQHTLAIEFEAAAAHVLGLQRSQVEVPNYHRQDLMLSDLLLAYHIEEQNGASEQPGYLLRNGLSIQPAPWGVYSVRQPLYLYFEVYYLQSDDRGQTEYEVEAILVDKEKETGLGGKIKGLLGRKKEDAVSIAFEREGTPTDDGQYLILDVSDQQPGDYVLIVQVKDLVRNETVETRRPVFLEE